MPWTEDALINSGQQVELFNLEELGLMASELPREKVPGPDNVSNKVGTELIKKKTDILLILFNKCLVTQTFPDRGKVTKLVVSYKGSMKLQTEPSSYRPISLLDEVDKLFVRLVL